MSENIMKKQALLIGINNYQMLPELRFARQDAEAVGDALIRNYCFSDKEVTLLTDDFTGFFNPLNKGIIQKHLDIWAEQDLDMFVFGFWGHGLYRNSERYLCPLDVMNESVEEHGVPFGQLQELISRIRAKNTIVILDCCQSIHDRGEMELLTDNEQTRLVNAARDIGIKRREINPEFVSNVAILNSCTKGQSAYEWDDRKHGIFTAHLLEAMNRRCDSVSKIISYLDDHVAQTALELGKDQKPFCKLEGSIDLPVNTETQPLVTGDVFISYRHANADLVAPIEEELKRQGISYFIDRVGINYGMTYSEALSRAMDECNVVLFVWTNEASGSPDLLKEITMANNLNKTIIPYKIGTFDKTQHRPFFYELGPTSCYDVPKQTDATVKEVVQRLKMALNGNCFVNTFPPTQTYSPKQEKHNYINVPQDCLTLEEACDTIEENGTIYLKPGVYKTSSTIILDRNITICGQSHNPQDAEIRFINDVFLIKDASPQIIGVTIHAKGDSACGIKIESGNPIIKSCHIMSDKGVGINITGETANPDINYCPIYNCGKIGVLVKQNGTGKIHKCNIYENTIGIRVSSQGNPVVTGCSIHDGGGLSVTFNGVGQFSNCDIYNNINYGIEVLSGGNPTITMCKIHDESSNGVDVHNNGAGEFNNCDIYENEGSGFYLKDNGYPKVTDCKIHNGKQSGVYVFDNGLGEFNHCDIYGNENSGVRIRTNGNPKMIGCKIHDGKDNGVYVLNRGAGEFYNCDIYGNVLEGIRIQNFGHPMVTDCLIHDGYDASVYVHDNGLGKFNNCDIYGNNASGFELKTGGNPTVTDCKIHDGKRTGVYIQDNSSGHFKNCEIYGNALAGINVETGSNPTVSSCSIHDGHDVGVSISNKGRGVFNDNTLHNNKCISIEKNWDIDYTALSVYGAGNNPMMPSRSFFGAIYLFFAIIIDCFFSEKNRS